MADGGVKESVAFKFTKKQISVGRSYTRAHSCAVFLKVVFGIKCEVIHGRDYSNEVANGFCRGMFICAFLKDKTTSINSFIMWDVSIQWRDIKRDRQGIIRKIVNGGEFVTKISGIFEYDCIVQTKGLRWKSTNCEMRSVGWLLEETMGLPGLLTLWILGRI